MKIEEVVISFEDLEYKKDIFKMYFFFNDEIENVGGWKSNIFQENLMILGFGMISEIVIVIVEDWGIVDLYFFLLDNIIDLGQDLWL